MWLLLLSRRGRSSVEGFRCWRRRLGVGRSRRTREVWVESRRKRWRRTLRLRRRGCSSRSLSRCRWMYSRRSERRARLRRRGRSSRSLSRWRWLDSRRSERSLRLRRRGCSGRSLSRWRWMYSKRNEPRVRWRIFGETVWGSRRCKWRNNNMWKSTAGASSRH